MASFCRASIYEVLLEEKRRKDARNSVCRVESVNLPFCEDEESRKGVSLKFSRVSSKRFFPFPLLEVSFLLPEHASEIRVGLIETHSKVF